MGKIRAKKRAARNRSQPTGLPSVEEVTVTKEQATEGYAPVNSQPLLQRLSNPDPSERRWACQSLSHLVFDHTHLNELVKGRVVRRLTPLLLDDCLDVREAAAGALRNMSSVDQTEVHQYIASEDIMTPLTAMLKDCHSRLESSADVVMETGPGGDMANGQTKGKNKKEGVGGKVGTEREGLLRIIEEGLCLLWNMSESSSLVVEVFNRDNLLPLILQLLQPAQYPLSLVVAAAQLLHIVTEDNQAAIQLICSSQPHLAHLESVLTFPEGGDHGQLLIIRTAIAGVFQNILPGLPEPLSTQTLRGVLGVLGSVIDMDLAPLLATLCERSTQCTDKGVEDSTLKSEVEGIRSLLSAQQLACEILANICYVESECDDCDEWEDCEVVIGDGVEEVVMDETDESQSPPSHDLPSLHLIVEMDVHSKVYNKLISVNTACYEACLATVWGKSLVKRLSTFLSSSLLALQNLLSSLPVESWGGPDKMAAIWSALFSLPNQYTDETFPVIGVLVVLAEKMEKLELVDVLTMDQLHKLSEVGLGAGMASVRADVMALLATAAKIALRNPSSMLPILTVIGSTLRDSVAKDTSLWVVSQALDSIFDLFGGDDCPSDLFSSLSLLPALRQVATTFVARLRIEKKSLGSQLSLVQSAKVNLPRFIEYMSTKH